MLKTIRKALGWPDTPEQAARRALMARTGAHRAGAWAAPALPSTDTVEAVARTNAVVESCLVLIAPAAAAAAFRVDHGSARTRDTGADRELLASVDRVLHRPNSRVSRSTFMSTLAESLLVRGECFIVSTPMVRRINGQRIPMALEAVPAAEISIERDREGEITAYRWQHGTQHRMLDPQHVAHIRDGRADDDDRGVPRLAAVFEELLIHNVLSLRARELAQHGNMPPAILSLEDDEAVDSETLQQLADLLDSWRRDSGETLTRLNVILGKLKVHALPRVADADQANLRAEAERVICGVLGVPTVLLSSGNATYENQRQARVTLYQSTVRRRVLEPIRAGLERLCGGIELAIDESAVDEVADMRLQTLEKLDKASFLTIDEKRHALGLPPIKGGNVLYLPSNLIAIDAEIAQPDPVDLEAITAGYFEAARKSCGHDHHQHHLIAAE